MSIVKKKIYLDYAATTPVDSRVLKAMNPYFSKEFGNTMSVHQWGKKTDEVVEKSRKTIAKIIGAKSEEIYFTGSATEANNLALKGIAWANKSRGNHIIISAIEHDCVMESARWLESQGFRVSRLGVDDEGLVNLEELERLITRETILVSVIHGNNEIGTLQDLEKIGEICRRRFVYFHSDASQSFGREPIDVVKMKIDLLTASSHKIYGPKGAACLYVRDGVMISPLLHGGGHENGLRSSTVNVPAVVGFGEAAKIMQKEGKKENARLKLLRDRLTNIVLKKINGVRLNGQVTKRLANNANFSFDYIEGEALALELNHFGIGVSTGSACSSASLNPSHVLLAIGLKPEQAHGSLRISLGRWTKKADIDYFIKVLTKAVLKLRKMSPFKK